MKRTFAALALLLFGMAFAEDFRWWGPDPNAPAPSSLTISSFGGQSALTVYCADQSGPYFDSPQQTEWHSETGLTYLRVSCEVHAHEVTSFYPSDLAYVVDGRQHKVGEVGHVDTVSGRLFGPVSGRFFVGLYEVTPEHAGEDFRLCYRSECMTLTVPEAPIEVSTN